MNVLFVVQPSHWRIGCHQIAKEYMRLLESSGAKTSLVVVPHHDVQGHSRWHYYADVALAKKSYDHVFAFESAPSDRWRESCDSITWVPMVEFTTTGHVESLKPGDRVVWHSAAGFEAQVSLRSDLSSSWTRFGVPVVDHEPAKRRSRPRILLHQRARCIDCAAVAAEILRMDPGVDVVVWDNLHRKSALKIPGATVVSGWMRRDDWVCLSSSCDLYLGSRAHEGVGLCLLEAAAAGCAIVAPRQTTSGEYFPGDTIEMVREAGDRSDYLCERYGWPSPAVVASEILGLASSRSSLDASRVRSWSAALEARVEFERFILDLGRSMKPRTIVQKPKSSRRVLSIQTCRWGGQGLQELWTLRAMGAEPHLSVFSACLWTQPYDEQEQEEHCRLLACSGARVVDLGSMGDTCPDVVVVHWSSGFEDRCSAEDLGSLESFLRSTTATVVVLAHNVDPTGWPTWLRPSVRIHPSQAAASAFHDDVPSVVLPHFIDPDADEVRATAPSRSRIVLGIIGRTIWTKFDPVYSEAVSDFLDECGGEVLWLGGRSADDLRGDERVMDAISPRLASVFGPGRFEVIDEMTVCLHLSGAQESFGLGPAEAVRRGVPVVTNRQEVYENLREASLLVGGPEDLTMVLRRIRQDPAVLRKLRDGCAKTSARMVNWRSWSRSFWNLVASATHERRGAKGRWTVIVPVHDVAPYIVQCLASVVANCPDDVIVVVDGGSDGSVDLVREFAERHEVVRVFEFPGPGHCQAWAWARGLERCRGGGFVAFVDGDDYLRPDALDVAARPYAEDPRLSLVWTDHVVVDVFGREVYGAESFSADPGGLSILDSIKSGSNTVSHMLTARHSALQLIVIDEELPATADKDLCLKLEEVGGVRRVPEKVYFYRTGRPGSVTTKTPDLQELCEASVLAKAERRRVRLPTLRE